MLLDSKEYNTPENNKDEKDNDKDNHKDLQIIKPPVRHRNRVELEEDNNNNYDGNDNVKWEDGSNNKDNKNRDTEKPWETFNTIVVQQVPYVNDCAKIVLWDNDASKVAVVTIALSSEAKQRFEQQPRT